VSINIKLAMLASVALLSTPAMAWESANDGGRLRHFTNTIDLNMRAWPAPMSQIVATLPRDSQMSADRCIRPEGLQDVWCHVDSGSSTGWVNAVYLRETGRNEAGVSPRYAYNGPMPAVTPQEIAPAAPVAPSAPIAPSAPPSLSQSTLPKCDNADIILKVVKLSLGFAGGITDYLIVGDTHALSINNIDGSKVCVANFRADLEKARAAETWITSGAHPLTQMAAEINRNYDMARPMHVTFSIRPNGEGGYTFRPINQ